MFGIGAGEIIVILIVALLVFGPERLPTVARQLGKAYRDLRIAGDELKYSLLDAEPVMPAKAGIQKEDKSDLNTESIIERTTTKSITHG